MRRDRRKEREEGERGQRLGRGAITRTEKRGEGLSVGKGRERGTRMVTG